MLQLNMGIEATRLILTRQGLTFAIANDPSSSILSLKAILPF